MRSKSLFAMGVFLTIASAASAQTPADFVGTWRLEVPKARAAAFAGPETRITTTQLTVSWVGEGLTVLRLVGQTTVTETYDPTRLSTVSVGLKGQARTVKTAWADSTLVIEETEVVSQPRGTATVKVTERWTVEDDGRLRVEVTSDTGTSTLTRTDRYVKQQ